MLEPFDIPTSAISGRRSGKFSRAADRLGISQPSVSQQMRDLEAGLRVLCFSAVGNGFAHATRFDFQEHARALLHQVENLLHELNGEPGELRGALRLGVIPGVECAARPQLLGALSPIISDQRRG